MLYLVMRELVKNLVEEKELLGTLFLISRQQSQKFTKCKNITF